MQPPPRPRSSRWSVALACAFACSAASGGEVLVAVASNFLEPLERIAPVCEAATGHLARPTAGSTGKLYSQIRLGAPFAVLLAADAETPRRLEAEGAAVPGTRFTYAVGRIVLWSPEEGRVDGTPAALRDGRYRHLALANPATAPYGRAAQQALERLGLWAQTKDRLVIGQSVAQAFGFVASGNADLGLVALSQLEGPGTSVAGSRWLVPAELHDPIEQQAVLLAPGRDDPAAIAFLSCLRSDSATAIIRDSGYELGGK